MPIRNIKIQTQEQGNRKEWPRAQEGLESQWSTK